MQRLTDEEIIYIAFQKYVECSKSKELPVLDAKQVIAKREDLLREAEKYLSLFRNRRIPFTQRKKLCNKGSLSLTTVFPKKQRKLSQQQA